MLYTQENLIKRGRWNTIKKKILVIIIAGLIATTIFGTISVSATSINKNKEAKPVFTADFDEAGDIGAFVITIKISEISTVPYIQLITDANVVCEDINGDIHEMEYVEHSPDKFFYIAYDVPAGPCYITASKQGFSTKTISAQVVPDGFKIYRIELKENPTTRPVILRMLDLLPNAFLISRLLFKL